MLHLVQVIDRKSKKLTPGLSHAGELPPETILLTHPVLKGLSLGIEDASNNIDNSKMVAHSKVDIFDVTVLW